MQQKVFGLGLKEDLDDSRSVLFFRFGIKKMEEKYE